MIQNPKAFVLMPFDPEFTSLFERLIKPTLEDKGYEVERADSLFDQENILRSIVRGISNANLIIADVTTLNPNVLYELGLAHGLRIPTVLLAQSIDEVPFDLRSYRILEYSLRFDHADDLKNALGEIAERHRRAGIAFGSPITDFLAPGPSILAVRQATEVGKPEAPLPPAEEAEEKGILDFLLEGTQAVEELAPMMVSIANETNNLHNNIVSRTEQIKDLEGRSEPGTAAQFYKINVLAANDLTSYSGKLEAGLPQLEERTDALIGGFLGYFGMVELRSDQDKQAAEVLRQTLLQFAEVVGNGLQSLRSFRGVFADLKGVSRVMNQASRRLTQTLGRLVSIFEKLQAFSTKTLTLLSEKLASSSKAS